MIFSKEISFELHRYNLNQIENCHLMKLKIAYNFCIMRDAKIDLFCDHFICVTCAETFKKSFFEAKREFVIQKCIVCKEIACLKIKNKSPIIDARVMSIDDELFNVDSLNHLMLMQTLLFKLSIQNLVDFLLKQNQIRDHLSNIVCFFSDWRRWLLRVEYKHSSVWRWSRWIFFKLTKKKKYDFKSFKDFFVRHFDFTLRMFDISFSLMFSSKIVVLIESSALFINYKNKTLREKSYDISLFKIVDFWLLTLTHR